MAGIECALRPPLHLFRNRQGQIRRCLTAWLGSLSNSTRGVRLEGALELIEESGLDSLTLRKLGDRVGVSNTALYRHFREKDALLKSICEEGFETLAELMREAEQSSGANFASRLKAVLVAAFGFAAANRAHARVMFGWRPSRLRSGAKYRSKSEEKAVQRLEKMLKKGQRKGEVRSGEVSMLARTVWGEVHGIAAMMWAADLEAEGAMAKLVHHATEVIGAGLTGKSTELVPPVRSERRSLREELARLARERQAAMGQDDNGH